MDKSEVHEWSRHYDTLLWNVTTLFAGAIGGLLVYTHSKFDVRIALFGMGLTLAPIYFGASFRESRDRVNQQMDATARTALFQGRKLKQWNVYVFLFMVIEGLWVMLLLENRPEHSCWWYSLGAMSIVGLIVLSCLGVQEQ